MNEDIAKYVSDNHLDANLNFVDGKLYLTNKQWSLIDNLLLNVYIDDGEGYIELGKDNIFDIDDKGNLLAINDMTWLAASIDDTNYEVVPFYYISTLIDGDNLITTGRIPVLLNDRYANLIIRIDNESIDVVGASFDYKDNNSTIAKNIIGLVSGDRIEFVCDYYSYDGEFNDTYKLGNPLIINDKLYLNDVNINDNKYLATYQITDIYQQDYYTSLMNN